MEKRKDTKKSCHNCGGRYECSLSFINRERDQLRTDFGKSGCKQYQSKNTINENIDTLQN